MSEQSPTPMGPNDSPDAVEAVDADPIALVLAWRADALVACPPRWIDAMVLATVDRDGRPQARAVLCRGIDQRGFVFYTNLDSPKATDLTARPSASAVFLWEALQRQVRVAGTVVPVSDEESDEYWRSRPRGHQISATASPQSRVVPDRDTLERMVDAVERSMPNDAPVPRPTFWGGFRLAPHTIEFWQGGDDRLHDRWRYERVADRWTVVRLAP